VTVLGLTDWKVLIVDHEKCGACHICELICSFTKEGVFSPTISRIRIRESSMDETILVCQLCKIAKCIEACTFGALSRDEKTGAIVLDYEKCRGSKCGDCVSACPYGAIFVDPRTGRVLICDLCGGEPACIRWCPRGAILFDFPEGEKAALKQKAERKLVAYKKGVRG
jgi:carbon-monoxide dehydrogenase iron sulfur subunit